MAIALVANSSVTNAQDTSGINTTGANLIVIAMAGGNNITPSDNKGNTYTGLTIRSQGGDDVRLWYCLSPTVGTGHTFHQQWSYEALFAAAFSGVATSAFDQENGTAGDGTDTSLAPGSITPSENNCLVITGLMAGLTNSNHSVDGGFTITNSINGVNGTNYGGAISYLIQTTAAAANPTHSWTSSVPAAVAIASFKAAGGSSASSSPSPSASSSPSPSPSPSSSSSPSPSVSSSPSPSVSSSPSPSPSPSTSSSPSPSSSSSPSPSSSSSPSPSPSESSSPSPSPSPSVSSSPSPSTSSSPSPSSSSSPSPSPSASSSPSPSASSSPSPSVSSSPSPSPSPSQSSSPSPSPSPSASSSPSPSPSASSSSSPSSSPSSAPTGWIEATLKMWDGSEWVLIDTTGT